MGKNGFVALLKIAAAVTAGLALMLATLIGSPAPAEAQPGSGLIFATDAKCIESNTVQGDPAAVSMGVGNVYEGTDGSRHLVTTGGPSCVFNCNMGLDANCDGVLFDTCPPHLNLDRVADVGACLAHFALISAPAAAAPVPTVDVGELAHTGNETTALAVVGAGLLSTGAYMMGIRRRLRD